MLDVSIPFLPLGLVSSFYTFSARLYSWCQFYRCKSKLFFFFYYYFPYLLASFFRRIEAYIPTKPRPNYELVSRLSPEVSFLKRISKAGDAFVCTTQALTYLTTLSQIYIGYKHTMQTNTAKSPAYLPIISRVFNIIPCKLKVAQIVERK